MLKKYLCWLISCGRGTWQPCKVNILVFPTKDEEHEKVIIETIIIIIETKSRWRKQKSSLKISCDAASFQSDIQPEERRAAIILSIAAEVPTPGTCARQLVLHQQSTGQPEIWACGTVSLARALMPGQNALFQLATTIGVRAVHRLWQDLFG